MITNYAELILEDPQARELLKTMILEKNRRYEEVLETRRAFMEINFYEKRDEFGKWFLEQIFDCLLEGRELVRIEKDLSSMCFYLRRSEGKISKRTAWEDQYDKATGQIRIGEVIQRYLRLDGFRRNIACPFHEDKSPSLKVYEDSNYFVCFGCGARGSPVDFVMKIENCLFKEAVSILSNF